MKNKGSAASDILISAFIVCAIAIILFGCEPPTVQPSPTPTPIVTPTPTPSATARPYGCEGQGNIRCCINVVPTWWCEGRAVTYGANCDIQGALGKEYICPPPIEASPTPTPSPTTATDPFAGLPVKGWHKEYAEWIKRNVPEGLLAAKRLDFCPNYATMDESQRREAWAVILQGIALYESSYNRATQYVERTMGIDPITGEQVKSEGLLQLSYQDGPNYKKYAPTCTLFNWQADKNLPLPDRSIMSAKNNLGCGLEIMNRLIVRWNDEVGATEALGKYWATMRRGTCPARKFIREKSACGAEIGGC